MIIKNPQQITKIREACQLTAKIQNLIKPLIRPGITTQQINDAVHSFIVQFGASPACLNYRGFPKSCCTSINNEVCHGIPSSTKILKPNDVLKLDIALNLNGFFGDTCVTYIVEPATDNSLKIFNKLSRAILLEAIKKARPGNYVGDISATIERLAKKYKLHPVKDYGGHGVGLQFHEEDLFISNVGKSKTGKQLKPGMIFTVEPMLNRLCSDVIKTAEGIIKTKLENDLSCQWEHTIMVTGAAPEILTFNER